MRPTPGATAYAGGYLFELVHWLLLDNGANPNANQTGATALMWAGDVEKVRLLLKAQRMQRRANSSQCRGLCR
jgi:hypothetical protein